MRFLNNLEFKISPHLLWFFQSIVCTILCNIDTHYHESDSLLRILASLMYHECNSLFYTNGSFENVQRDFLFRCWPGYRVLSSYVCIASDDVTYVKRIHTDTMDSNAFVFLRAILSLSPDANAVQSE